MQRGVLIKSNIKGGSKRCYYFSELRPCRINWTNVLDMASLGTKTSQYLCGNEALTKAKTKLVGANFQFMTWAAPRLKNGELMPEEILNLYELKIRPCVNLIFFRSSASLFFHILTHGLSQETDRAATKRKWQPCLSIKILQQWTKEFHTCFCVATGVPGMIAGSGCLRKVLECVIFTSFPAFVRFFLCQSLMRFFSIFTKSHKNSWVNFYIKRNSCWYHLMDIKIIRLLFLLNVSPWGWCTTRVPKVWVGVRCAKQATSNGIGHIIHSNHLLMMLDHR